MHQKGDNVTLGDLAHGTSFRLIEDGVEYMVLAHVEELEVTFGGFRAIPFVGCDQVFTLMSLDAATDVIVEDPKKFLKMKLTKSA